MAFIVNMIPPYRRTFYEKLCRQGSFEWLIVHGAKTNEDGRPQFEGEIEAPTQAVRNCEVKVGPFSIRWQGGALAAVREFDPDLVIIPGIGGTVTNWLLLAWAKLHRRIVIMWTCGWESQRAGSIAHRTKQAIVRMYFSLADWHLVYGSKARQYLLGHGVADALVEICYNGLEVDPLLATEKDVWRRSQRLREEGGVVGKHLFLYVGAMLKEKRVDCLLEAFSDVCKETRGAALWLVGDGPDRCFFETQAAQLGVPGIRFLGRITDDVDPYFAAADCFVLPGLGGLALNQAMFWKTPCIVGEADGTEEDLIFEGDTGWRLESADSRTLADAMRKAMRLTEAERREMGERGRSIIAARSNVTVMVDTFVSAIQNFFPIGGDKKPQHSVS